MQGTLQQPAHTIKQGSYKGGSWYGDNPCDDDIPGDSLAHRRQPANRTDPNDPASDRVRGWRLAAKGDSVMANDVDAHWWVSCWRQPSADGDHTHALFARPKPLYSG
jgi:hypothetical protein